MLFSLIFAPAGRGRRSLCAHFGLLVVTRQTIGKRIVGIRVLRRGDRVGALPRSEPSTIRLLLREIVVKPALFGACWLFSFLRVFAHLLLPPTPSSIGIFIEQVLFICTGGYRILLESTLSDELLDTVVVDVPSAAKRSSASAKKTS